MKIRIYYHHTDSGGVVYYGEYLKFLEEARTEYLEDKGLSIKELLKEDIIFVVRYQETRLLPKQRQFWSVWIETLNLKNCPQI